MVLLDTNVVSDLMLASPNPEVLAWVDNQPSRELFVTAITEAEVRTGIAFLPEGARRRGLVDAVERTLGSLFADRVLPFDSGCGARLCGGCRRPPRCRTANFAVGLPDRGDRARARDGRGDAKRPGFLRNRGRCDRPVGGCVRASLYQAGVSTE